MHYIPTGSFLGKIEIDKIIEYYDFPRLFSCQSNTGQRYIALSICDNEDIFDWLYVAVSEYRESAVFNGKFPLVDAFKNPESGYLFKVITYESKQASKIEYLLPEQVSEEDLPLADYVISSDFPEKNLAKNKSTAQHIATATRRETFDYRIFPNESHIHEIPARKFGGILTATQELFDALGQAATGQPSTRGPIATEILQRTKLQVPRTFPGSFGVQFCSEEYSDLFNDSLIARALSEFLSIIIAKDSENLLSNKLHNLKGRVASKYRKLLKELADLNSGLAFDWGSVLPERGGASEMSAEQVRNAYMIVDRIEIEMADKITIKGKLIGFNSRTRRYEIMSSEDGRAYSGKVADDVILEIQNPSIDQLYEVELRMLVEIQSTSGDELIKWVLVRLGPLKPSKAF